MNKLYLVIKDGEPEACRENREEALAMARESSGLECGLPLGNVDLWEIGLAEDKPKMIWHCEWEPSGPLEANIIASSPSLAPTA